MNRSLQYGEGLFETIRWRGENRKLKLHYRRLSDSADFLNIPCPRYEDFISYIKTAVGGDNNKYVKFCLLSEGEDYFAGKPGGYRIDVMVRELPVPPERVSLCISDYRRHSLNPLFRHKSTNYLFNILVKREAVSRGFFDCIVLNEKGNLTECSSSNLLIVKGSRLITPNRGEGLLWGTTLEAICQSLGVEEKEIKPEELFGCDGLFILNSLMGAVPVERIEDRALPVDVELGKLLNSKIEEFEIGL